jgi:hypothetical protein
MRVEPECYKFPQYGAGVSEQFSDKGMTYVERSSLKSEGAKCHLLVSNLEWSQ